MMNFQTTEAAARQLDERDPLASFRKEFYLPVREDGSECIYLCGNSLGLQPRRAKEFVDREMEDWARFGVEGHFQARSPWMPYHELLTQQTATIVGAQPSEVVVMNTLTVNLHLMMVSFYRPTPGRHKILMEAHAFPSDIYAAQSQIRFHGYDPATALLEIKPREGESFIRTSDIEELLEREGDSIALVLIGGVNYYSGQVFEMARITAAARAHGCLVGFDLAHGVGNIVLELHDWDVDFAVWCSYKYLNGGPGCSAGCFVHERHATADVPRFAGWWGQNKETRFLMEPSFEPIAGAEGWQLSNPPILAMAALRASLELFGRAGLPALRQKSESLTGYLEFLLRELAGSFVAVLTPASPAERGCQLSLQVSGNGQLLHQRLQARGVVCDWREPDVIRVAPVPFYNSYLDVYRFVRILQEEYVRLSS